MEEVVLALVSGDVSLTQALESIRKGTRALVVHSPNRSPLLVTAGDIMAAMNDCLDGKGDPGNVRLSTVIPARMPALAPVEPPTDSSSRSFGARAFAVAPALLAKSQYDAIFAEKDDRYAIHELRSDEAVVVTAGKRLAADLNTAITICRCAGDPVHTFEPHQIVNPGVCNKPHGAEVICQRLDGLV